MLWSALQRRLFRLRYHLSPFCHVGDEPAPMTTRLAMHDGTVGVPVFATLPSRSWKCESIYLRRNFCANFLCIPSAAPSFNDGRQLHTPWRHCRVTRMPCWLMRASRLRRRTGAYKKVLAFDAMAMARYFVQRRIDSLASAYVGSEPSFFCYHGMSPD